MSESDSKPLYNSRIVSTYLKFLRKHYPSVNVGELLQYAKMRSYEVADQNHWFTQVQINRFHEKMELMTGSKTIAREAGRYAANPETIGVMRQYMLGLVNPLKAYGMTEKAMQNFSRSCRTKSHAIAPNRVEITITPEPGVSERPFQCQNRMGFFEAITILFTSRLPQIKHPECMFKGDRCCRYIISWDISLSSVLRIIRNWSLAPVAVALLFGALIMTLPHFLFFAAAFTASELLLTWILENIEKKELKLSLTNLWESNEKLLDQMEINYKNALMANEIGQVISRQTRIDDVLDQVIRISVELLGFDRGLLMLSNEEKTRLEFRAGFGYTKEQYLVLRNTAFNLDKPNSKGIFIVSFREQKPYLINSYNELEDTLSPRSLKFAQKMGAQSFICCPIICDGESVGILTVDNLRSKRPLVHSDMSLLMGIAPIIGISLRNAELL